MYKSAMYATLALISMTTLYAEETAAPSPEAVPAEVVAASNSSSPSFFRMDRRSKKKEKPPEPTISIEAEFLYWQPSLDGYAYAQTGFLNPSFMPGPGNMTVAALEPNQGTNLAMPNSYHPGFRVTLQGSPNNNDWSFGARYLWFYGSDNRVATTSKRNYFQNPVSTTETDLIFLQYGFAVDLDTTRVSADWTQRYQLGDLFFSRNYAVNKHLKLCPYAGARGTWQTKRAVFNYGHNVPLTLVDGSYETPPYELRVTQENNHWGLGLVAGLDSTWYFNKYVSIYGGFGLSGLWMRQTPQMQVRLTYVGSDPSGEANPEDLNYIYPVTSALVANQNGERLSHLQAMFDYALGLRLETGFSEDKYHVAVQVGWEGQYWPNQVLMLRPTDKTVTIATPMLDYALQGLTAKLEFSF